jgi:hypothetical protein
MCQGGFSRTGQAGKPDDSSFVSVALFSLFPINMGLMPDDIVI